MRPPCGVVDAASALHLIWYRIEDETRSGAALGGDIVWIIQGAVLHRKAPAADASVKAVAEASENTNSFIEGLAK